MPLFKFPSLKFLNRNAQSNPGIISTVQPTAPQPPAASAPQQPKSLAALEQEMEIEVQYVHVQPVRRAAPNRVRQTFNKIKWAAILIGVPVGIVWFVNLPYPMIRRPVARTVPILLLPSYVSMDHNYRQAIASVEQAGQLINNATSPADIDLGEQKVEQAQESLDALPIGFLNDFPEYRYWWYDWRFSSSQFNAARITVGQLEVKVFQEKNAQNVLLEAEQALNIAKQQYQQATTSVDKSVAIANWQASLDQLTQIPSQTLAGRTAQQKLVAAERDFQEVVGLAAGNERVSIMIQAAREFGSQAAQEGQNPPHSVAEWQQVEHLWEEAIARLERVREDDLAGYEVAQPLLAEYRRNLGVIQVRRQAEQDSAQALQSDKLRLLDCSLMLMQTASTILLVNSKKSFTR